MVVQVSLPSASGGCWPLAVLAGQPNKNNMPALQFALFTHSPLSHQQQRNSNSSEPATNANVLFSSDRLSFALQLALHRLILANNSHLLSKLSQPKSSPTMHFIQFVQQCHFHLFLSPNVRY